MRVSALIAASLCFALPALAGGRENLTLKRDELGYLLADVTLNDDTETRGVVDTAATFAMIDAAAAGLAGVKAPSATAARIDVLGLNGPRTYPVIRLDSVRIGTAEFRGVAAAYNGTDAMPGARAVLPALAFEGDVADFNFPKGRVSFYKGKPDAPDGGYSGNTRLEVKDGLMFASVSINGVKGTALIDTGAPLSFINPAFAEAAGIDAKTERSVSLEGATGGASSVRIAYTKQFAVADYAMARMKLLVSDPPLFAHLGLDEAPAMVLGLDILASFRVQIDRRRSKLILSQPDREGGMSIRTNPRGSRIPE
jgi:predicted aspartyl protease